MQKGKELFVTLVTEVSLISREANLRFERISISRRFLWKSFSSFRFCTLHDFSEHKKSLNVEMSSAEGKRTERFSEKCRLQYVFNVSNHLVRIGSV